MSKIDFINEIAKRKANVNGWMPCRWELIDNVTIVTGGVPIGKRRDGRPKWGPEKSLTRVAVTDEEVREDESRYEAATGNCADCGGSGKEIAAISVAHGVSYRNCGRCNGAGKAVAA